MQFKFSSFSCLILFTERREYENQIFNEAKRLFELQFQKYNDKINKRMFIAAQNMHVVQYSKYMDKKTDYSNRLNEYMESIESVTKF